MPKKLLLADDSITIQKVVGITFAQEDFDITYVDNGVDAIKKAEEIQPDVILADIVMPQKTGYDVCESVKNNPSLKHIPVLLLAGTFETFDVNRGKMVGADDYIIKPFESQALIDKVNSLLTGGAAAPTPAAEVAEPAPTPPAAPEPPSAPEIPTVDVPEVPDIADIAASPVDVAIDAPDIPDIGASATVDETTQSAANEPAADTAFDIDSFVSEPPAAAPPPAMDPEPTEAAAVAPADITEAAPISEGIELASAADMMMDTPPSETETSADVGGDLPPLPEIDQFGLGGFDDAASPAADLTAGSDSLSTADDFTANGGGDEVDLPDLPPLPDEGMLEADQAPAVEAAPVSAAPPAVQIDEAEVKRIVEEQVRGVVEKVAWEVIPELAERLIKAEIQRLSDEPGA